MKTAVVTGAAQGVGRAVARTLAQSGYRVVLTDLQVLDDVVDSLRSEGAQAVGRSGDIRADGFADALADWVHEQFGAVDVLVNNAGISLIAPALETTAAQWRQVMDVNLLGPFLLSQAFGAPMLSGRRGSIINIASIAGLAGIAHRSAYNASKHGLIGLTRTLAAEWGGHGVRVNAVCPGWIKTEMDTADQGSGAYSDSDIIDRVPSARFATAEDVARAVAFLADPEKSGFINGASLPVDGGWTADAGWQSLRLRARQATS